MNNTTDSTSDREITLSRVLDAPRERVWRAMTDPKQIDRWWGPDGFRNVTQAWDFRPGGLWKHVMIGPDGSEYSNTTKFLEIVEPESIAYANAGGKKGEKEVSHLMTFSLKALGPSKTEVTVHHVFGTRQERDFVIERYGVVEGGKQTLARLDQHVTKNVSAATPGFELRLERVINAPRERVFEAWSKPEQLAQWFAPKPWSLAIDKMDFRAGGRFKMAMISPEGTRHGFEGIYIEVVVPKKIVWTGEFPGDPVDNIRTEVFFEDQDGRTKIIAHQTFAVLTPINEGPIKGAKQGWTMTLDQLASFCRTRTRGLF